MKEIPAGFTQGPNLWFNRGLSNKTTVGSLGTNPEMTVCRVGWSPSLKSIPAAGRSLPRQGFKLPGSSDSGAGNVGLWSRSTFGGHAWSEAERRNGPGRAGTRTLPRVSDHPGGVCGLLAKPRSWGAQQRPRSPTVAVLSAEGEGGPDSRLSWNREYVGRHSHNTTDLRNSEPLLTWSWGGVSSQASRGCLASAWATYERTPLGKNRG